MEKGRRSRGGGFLLPRPAVLSGRSLPGLLPRIILTTDLATPRGPKGMVRPGACRPYSPRVGPLFPNQSQAGHRRLFARTPHRRIAPPELKDDAHPSIF